MRRWIVAGAALSLVLGAALYTLAEGAQPEPQMLSGEVVSLVNYVRSGHLGEEHSRVGQALVGKKGLPVAILDDATGELYIAVLKLNTAANAKLTPLIGKKVNARGPVYRRNGINLIEIQIVSEQ